MESKKNQKKAKGNYGMMRSDTIKKAKRGVIGRVECKEMRKEYKMLISSKKEKQNVKRLREKEDDRSMKRFWERIKIKKRKVVISEKIIRDQCRTFLQGST